MDTMNNLSKLLVSVRSNTSHKLTEISIDDLIYNHTPYNEFTLSTWKEYLKNDIIEEEEEGVSSSSNLENFKNEMMINFTNPSIGKEIPNIASIYGIIFI